MLIHSSLYVNRVTDPALGPHVHPAQRPNDARLINLGPFPHCLSLSISPHSGCHRGAMRHTQHLALLLAHPNLPRRLRQLPQPREHELRLVDDRVEGKHLPAGRR